jgi:hypothetical protein
VEPAAAAAQLHPDLALQPEPEPELESESQIHVETDEEHDRREAKRLMQRHGLQQPDVATLSALRTNSKGLSATLDMVLRTKLQVRTSLLTCSLSQRRLCAGALSARCLGGFGRCLN